MIPADDNRRFQFAAGDQAIEREAEFVALSVTEPADARRQSLESHAFLGEPDPPAEDFVVWEHLADQRIGAVDVRRLARKRYPAERAATLAEERSDIGGHEPGEIVGVLYTLLVRKGADVIAVVERYRA